MCSVVSDFSQSPPSVRFHSDLTNMSKDHQAIAINDAVHKIQLSLLNGITSQTHLFSAMALMSQSDYEDVVTERTIAKLCGYPLCRSPLPSDVSRRGKYRVSLKEHRVYDVRESQKFCSGECLVSSRAFGKSLQEVRTSEFDMVKLGGIVGLFGGGDGDVVEEEEGLGLGLGKLTICEKSDVLRGGEVDLEEWMGPSSAVEGYVPFDRSNVKSRDGSKESKAKNKQKRQEEPSFNEMGFTSTVIVPDECSVSSYNSKQDSKAKNNQKKQEDPPFNEMGFTSEVIIPDECSVSKVPPQTKQTPPVVKPEDGQGKTPKKSSKHACAGFRREKEKEKIDFASFGFDAMGCASPVTASDGYSVEYSVSKQPPSSTEDPLGGQMKDGLKPLDEKSSLSASKGKGFRPPPRRKQASLVGESSKGKTVVTITEKDIQSSLADEMGVMSDGYSVEYNVSKHPPSSMEDSLSSHLEGSQTLDKKNALLGSSSGSNTKALGKKVISDSCEGLKAHKDMCSSSEIVTKSCLKVSGSKKPSHSVTWADQSDGVRGDLCEVRSNDIESGLNTEDVSRLALAEACAKALSQAAEAVSSGDLDASDAAAKAGIVLLPSTHQLDEEVSEEEMSEEEEEEEATLLKWPNKPGTPDSDLFERDQSWFDETPEGFNLTLSPFAMMWDSLFGWVSSSSLAYIYGKDESAHEEFLSVNGKEYPRRIRLGEGLSSEIKETIAGCLARAVSTVATVLKLPVPISELEKGLGSLLETLSLTGAVPSFRVEQWLVVVLLFLDALSVCRIPRIAPYILNRSKVLEGSGIGNEEYETMKEILLPLGRVPQFATLCGA
uniref:RNA polymerase II subunit B1 CTD phosphatase RPAP2 homolog n=1 Tax=Brassica oleracea var. oleracea TaxID=109376 RepID=A0A0D3AXD9_BRAOL